MVTISSNVIIWSICSMVSEGGGCMYLVLEVPLEATDHFLEPIQLLYLYRIG